MNWNDLVGAIGRGVDFAQQLQNTGAGRFLTKLQKTGMRQVQGPPRPRDLPSYPYDPYDPPTRSSSNLTTRRNNVPRNVYGDPISYEDAGMLPPRRRRRGITARDLASFRRVANLIRKYAAPVRHFRKHPKGR